MYTEIRAETAVGILAYDSRFNNSILFSKLLLVFLTQLFSYCLIFEKYKKRKKNHDVFPLLSWLRFGVVAFRSEDLVARLKNCSFASLTKIILCMEQSYGPVIRSSCLIYSA